jgi:hypothetical protein
VCQFVARQANFCGDLLTEMFVLLKKRGKNGMLGPFVANLRLCCGRLGGRAATKFPLKSHCRQLVNKFNH